MLNMGGPSTLDEVGPFLIRLFSDPTIISMPFQKWLGPLAARARTPGVRKLYAAIGGGSPIHSWTTKQGNGMTKLLDELSPETAPHIPYVAFRYAPPLTADTVAAMARDGVKRAIAFSQYPQYSCATTGSSLQHLWSTLFEMGLENQFQWSVIDRWYCHPKYIESVVHKIQEGLIKHFEPHDRHHVTLIFSAHSLPMKRVLKGDPYPHEIAATVQAVVHQLDYRYKYIISFQSRVGPVAWLGPSTVAVVQSLAHAHHKHALVVPIAFTSDHVETLSEIDIDLKHTAKQAGVNLHRAPSLNDEPVFVSALASIVHEHIKSGVIASPQYPIKCVGCPNIRPTANIDPLAVPCRHVVNAIK